MSDEKTDYKHSGVYTSAYSFFNQNPSIKPKEWKDVEWSDCEDIQDAVGGDYTVIYTGDWSYEMRNVMATALGQSVGLGLSEEQDIVVAHNNQYVTLMQTFLNRHGIDYRLSSDGKNIII